MQALLSAKMQAMDPTSRSFYEEDGKDLDFYDFEPLPTLPEDEVSPSRKPTCPGEGVGERSGASTALLLHRFWPP